MDLGNVFFFFFLSLFFFYLLIKKVIFFRETYLDKDFLKPQAFHHNPIPRIGGVIILINSLIYLLLFYPANIFFYSVVLLGFFYFILGFLEDLKFNIKPELRLLIMFLGSLFIIYILEIKINDTQLNFLNNLVNYNKISVALFVCFSLLFIINGSNFIDGFNGLLVIQYLIILIFLYFLIYNLNDFSYLKNYIFLSILLGFSFLIFNFPHAKIFLGDGGAYFLGTNLSLIIIEFSNLDLNSKFPPFLFACLLFYIFFEVFFSFFRKFILKKTSPLKPDKEHLHMLLYIYIEKKINNPNKSNYLTAVIINLFYLLLITPLFFIYTNKNYCKNYFIILLFFYILFYSFVLTKKKISSF